MLAVNYSAVRNGLKSYCDKATDEDETIIVTRKAEKNVVILSLDKYNKMLKAIRNANYMSMIDESMAQFTAGKGNAVVVSEDEYNGLLETLKLCSMQGTKEDILCGKNTPLEQCIPAEDVVW